MSNPGFLFLHVDATTCASYIADNHISLVMLECLSMLSTSYQYHLCEPIPLLCKPKYSRLSAWCGYTTETYEYTLQLWEALSYRQLIVHRELKTEASRYSIRKLFTGAVHILPNNGWVNPPLGTEPTDYLRFRTYYKTCNPRYVRIPRPHWNPLSFGKGPDKPETDPSVDREGADHQPP